MADIPSVNTNVLQGGAVAPPYAGINTMPISVPNYSSSVSSSPFDLAGFASSAGTSIINKGLDLLSSHFQRKWSEKMFDKQNEWNLNMWNMANAYNSPAAQKQRMTEAGLNPLNYGLDGSSASPMQSAQPLGYERSTVGIQNPLQQGADYSAKIAQVENIKADTALKSNQTLSEEQRRENLIKEREEMDSRITKNISESNLNDKLRAKAEQYLKYGDALYTAQIDKDSAFADLTKVQKERIKQLLPGELALQRMSIKDFVQKWKYWNAQIGHLAKQDALIAKQSKYYLISLLNNGLYGTGLSAINSYIFSEIANDPDLSSDEKQKLQDLFVPDESKGYSKGDRERDKAYENWSLGLAGPY